MTVTERGIALVLIVLFGSGLFAMLQQPPTMRPADCVYQEAR